MTFITTSQLQALDINMADFHDYLVGKYDFISKLDMLLIEKERRIQYYHLSVSQAVTVWNKVYGD